MFDSAKQQNYAKQVQIYPKRLRITVRWLPYCLLSRAPSTEAPEGAIYRGS